MGIRQLDGGFFLLLLLIFLPLIHALPPNPGLPSKDNYWPFFEKTPDGTYKHVNVIHFDYVPPSLKADPATKDVTINPTTNVTARLIYPGPNPTIHNNNNNNNKTTKHPLLIYFHGGAFCIGSTYSTNDTTFLYTLSKKSNSIILSVEYRLFPPTPLPAAYEDGWLALQYAISPNNTEPWLTHHVDFTKLYIGGDSAGGNLAHNILKRAGKQPLPNGITIRGGILAMPYFLSNELRPKGVDGLMSLFNIWPIICPKCIGVNGMDDPCVNPMKDRDLRKLAGIKIMVNLAGDDNLRPFGEAYVKAVEKSGWKGEIKCNVAVKSTHVYHITSPNSFQTKHLIKIMAEFID